MNLSRIELDPEAIRLCKALAAMLDTGDGEQASGIDKVTYMINNSIKSLLKDCLITLVSGETAVEAHTRRETAIPTPQEVADAPYSPYGMGDPLPEDISFADLPEIDPSSQGGFLGERIQSPAQDDYSRPPAPATKDAAPVEVPSNWGPNVRVRVSDVRD